MAKIYSLENNSSECDSPHVASELPLIFVIHKKTVSKKMGPHTFQSPDRINHQLTISQRGKILPANFKSFMRWVSIQNFWHFAILLNYQSLMRHWDFVSSCDLHLHLASTNNAAAYYLPLGHQTVRAPLEKNCHSQIMRRQQELFGEGSRSGLQNWYSCFCQDVKMVDAGMVRNHVCY